MKFGFIGGTPRGQQLFSALVSDGCIPLFALFLKEDPHENSIVSDQMQEQAASLGIEARIDKKLRDSDYEALQRLKPDFVIVCGWRTLIDLSRIPQMTYGLLAAHDSLLPRYRGFAPMNWAIIEGESETGVSLFQIQEGEVDSGDILIQKKVMIEPMDTVVEVYKKITHATVEAYRSFISAFTSGKPILPVPQDETQATYTCKRVPDDGRINWHDSSERVYNLIRALVYPYSGAFFDFNGQRMVIRSASPGNQTNRVFSGRIPGRVISSGADGVEVLCGTGSILIHLLESADPENPIPAGNVIQSITATLR